MDDLQALVAANTEAAAAIAAAYEVLLGGVPNIAGFEFLIENALDTNFGSNNPDIEFNQENIFINVANALVQGNDDAAAAFHALTGGAVTLRGQVEALYNSIFANGVGTPEGLAYATRPEALEFYKAVAAERGVSGSDGAAIVALASMLNIAFENNTQGIGDATNDLMKAILDGSAELPASGNVFTPIEIADGTDGDNVHGGNYDADDVIGKTISLTDRIDAPGIDESQPASGRDTTGTDFNDLYIADAATLGVGDRIDGNGGTDTLDLTVSGFPMGGGGFLHTLDSVNLENINVRAQDSFVVLDLSLTQSAEILGARGTGGMTGMSGVLFTEVQNSVELEINSLTGLVALEYDADALGDETSQTVRVNNTFAFLGFQTTGAEEITTLDLTASGKSSAISLSDGGGLNLETINIAGSAAVAIGGGSGELDGVTTVNGSANTGGFLINLQGNQEDLVVTGSSGNDVVVLGSGGLTADDAIDLGAGDFDQVTIAADDIVQIDSSTLDKDVTLAGVEILGIRGWMGGDATIELNDFSFDQIHLYELQGGGSYLVQNSDAAATAASYTGSTLTLDDADGQLIRVYGNNDLQISFSSTDDVTMEVGTASDNAAIVAIGEALDTIGFGGTESQFLSGLEGQSANINGLDLGHGVETASLVLNGDLYIDTLILGADLETVTVSGSGDLDINQGLGDSSGLTLIDLSGLTGGFDNIGADPYGAQTFLIGDIGNARIGLGDQLGGLLGDGFRDIVKFTSDFSSTVEIHNFVDSFVDMPTDDIIDFSGLGINWGDLIIADDGAGNASITSATGFDGEILLMGVNHLFLTQNDFIF